LVRVEDIRVLPAFYSVLRDTLVATDLDQGLRIAYGQQRYRVVTLDGNVIDGPGGSVLCGVPSQIRGRMGQKVSNKEEHEPEPEPLKVYTTEELEEQQFEQI
jgi:structural maintenance of chromosome 4